MVVVNVRTVWQVMSAQTVISHNVFVRYGVPRCRRDQRQSVMDHSEHSIVVLVEHGRFPQGYVFVGVGR